MSTTLVSKIPLKVVDMSIWTLLDSIEVSTLFSFFCCSRSPFFFVPGAGIGFQYLFLGLSTDYGYPVRLFLQQIVNVLNNLRDRLNRLWGVWGIFESAQPAKIFGICWKKTLSGVHSSNTFSNSWQRRTPTCCTSNDYVWDNLARLKSKKNLVPNIIKTFCFEIYWPLRNTYSYIH